MCYLNAKSAKDFVGIHFSQYVLFSTVILLQCHLLDTNYSFYRKKSVIECNGMGKKTYYLQNKIHSVNYAKWQTCRIIYAEEKMSLNFTVVKLHEFSCQKI